MRISDWSSDVCSSDLGRLHVAAMCVGTAERLIEDSTRYAAEREQFGRPIGEFQLVQAMLADSRTEAYAARCMVLETARRFDRGAVISRSEEQTSELQSLMRISYDDFCLKKKKH